MQFIFIVLCAFFSCTKVTTQGYLSKGNIKNSVDSVFANCLVFAFTFVIFSGALRNGVKVPVLIYAALFGMLGVSFQVFYALALKSGPFSATCMLVNLNMVIPVTFSLVYYNEKATFIKVLGIALCLLALFLNVKSDGRKVNLRWFIYVSSAFLSTGGIAVVQKIFAKSAYGDNLEQFIFFGYLIAFLSISIVFFIQSKSGHKKNFKVTRKNLMLVIIIAASLGVFQFLYTKANSFVDAIILVPSVSGLATVFQMVSGRIIFKEKFTGRQIFSICTGILAILIISL